MISSNVETVNFTSLLNKVMLPDFQRVADDIHVDKIYFGLEQDFKEKKPIFTGIIIVGTMGQKVILLDGQHRMNAFKRLYDTYKRDFPVHIMNVIVSKDDDFIDIFVKLNSHKPVEIFTSIKEQININEVIRWFKGEFGEFIKQTNKPVGFNFNLDSLISEMNDMKSLCFHSAKDVIDGFKKILFKFQSISPDNMNWLSDSNIKKLKEYRAMCKTVPEFMKLSNKVLLQSIDYILSGKDVDIAALLTHYKNPKKKRMVLWNLYNKSDMVGACYCCEEKLNFDDMQASHVIAKAIGGGDELDNLRPCCHTCNNEMGIQNLETYKLKF